MQRALAYYATQNIYELLLSLVLFHTILKNKFYFISFAKSIQGTHQPLIAAHVFTIQMYSREINRNIKHAFAFALLKCPTICTSLRSTESKYSTTVACYAQVLAPRHMREQNLRSHERSSTYMSEIANHLASLAPIALAQSQSAEARETTQQRLAALRTRISDYEQVMQDYDDFVQDERMRSKSAD